MSANDVMLTTIDNPFDPFDEFDKWYAFDREKGYETCGLLARITTTSTELPESFQVDDIEEAIDEWLKLDVTGLFKKVTR